MSGPTPGHERGDRLRRSVGSAGDTPGDRDAAIDELRQIYFRHRESITGPAGTRKARPLAERERDRQRLATLYSFLAAGPDKMLDARTLGVLVDAHGATQRDALTGLVTAGERLHMLAVVVRRSAFPVVSIARPATLRLAPLLGRRSDRTDAAGEGGAPGLASLLPSASKEATVTEAVAGLPTRNAQTVTAVPIATEEIEAARRVVAARAARGLGPRELPMLDLATAQHLSTLATGRTQRLVTTPGGATLVPRADDDSVPTSESPAAGATSRSPADLPAPSVSRPVAICLHYPPAAAALVSEVSLPVAKKGRRHTD